MLSEYVHHITTWLSYHPHWTGAITFLIAFSETFALVGAIIPGSVTLTAIGVLIGLGVAPFTVTMICAIVGAFLGDATSYWLGRQFHGRLRNSWPFKNYPQLLDKGDEFFKRHGGKSIIIGRFIGPMRSIIPLSAGMMDMPAKKFLFYDFISSLVWAPSYILPGILIGAASSELSPAIAERVIIYVFAGIITLFFLSWLIKLMVEFGLEHIDRKLEQLWSYLYRHKPGHFLTTLLLDPSKPQGHRQLLLFFSFLISSSLFLILAMTVKYSHLLNSINLIVFNLLQSIRTLHLDKAMIGISFAGEKTVLFIVLLTVSVWLLYQRHWREAFYWIFNGILAVISTSLFKIWTHSPRPTGLVVVSDSFSFPSGHATFSVAIFGLLSVFVAKQVDRDIPKQIIFIPLIILTGLIIFSRIFIGDHWLSDIIGGVLLGVSCVLFSTIAWQRQLTKQINILGLLFITGISFSLGYLYYFSKHFDRELMNHQPYFPAVVVSHEAWKNQTSPLFPLYRNSRTGKPIEVLNIQWADTLSDIEKKLSHQQWEKSNPPTLTNRIERLLVKNKSQHLPAIDKLYQLERPALVMTKSVSPSKPIVVLFLWPSRLVFTDRNTPLWIGSVHYRHIYSSPELSEEENEISPEPLSILIDDLKTTPHREVEFPSKINQPNVPRTPVKVLLIYSE